MDKTKLINLITTGDFAGAKEYILSQKENCLEDLEVMKYLGLCNINLGCAKEAIENYEVVVKNDEEDALSMYYLATLYIDSDKLDELNKSVSLFKKVIGLREDYLDAYKMLCVCYIRLRKFNEIIDIQDKLLSLGSEDIAIYDLISSAYFEMKMYDESIKILEAALAHSENKDTVYFKMGLSYFYENEFEKAAESFAKAAEINDKVAAYFYHLGLTYYTCEKFEEAEEFLAKAVELEENNLYLIVYSNAALKANKFESAVKVLEKLVELNPNNETHKYSLACAYEGMGNLDKASKIIEKLLTFNLNSISLKLYLARLYSARNMDESAKILYADVIEAGHCTQDVLYQYAVLCMSTGESDKSEEIYKKLISDNPRFAYAYKDLGILYLTRKFFDQAKENFEKAYELEPDNINIVYEYANYYHLMSDFVKAQELYDKLLKKHNLPAIMLATIALNCISANDIDKAKEILEIAIKKAPQDVNVLFYLAQVYYIKKNYENARQLLEDAYTIMSNSEIANLLAQVYYELKLYDKALPLFIKLKEANPSSISILMYLAKVQFERGEYELSQKYAQEILCVLPEYEDALEIIEKIKNKQNS